MSEKIPLEQIKAVLKDQHEQSDRINWDLPIVVASSAAGWYVGMVDTDGVPYARFSVQYWPSEEEAQDALDYGDFDAKLWL